MLDDIHRSRFNPKRFQLPPDREAEATLMAPQNWPAGAEQRIPQKVGHYALEVRVNHGAWIVACPCGSAQLASRTDKRFFCVECGNTLFGGDWVKVEWPRTHKAIEQTLLERPLRQNRNWAPGETLPELREENAFHAPEIEAIKNLARRDE